MNLKRTLRAFTLIELLVVIVVIGILASLSVGTYGNYISSSKTANIKKTVNDLDRYTSIYARENDVLYSEINIDNFLDRFGMTQLPYGDIVYVADDYDFFYMATIPSTDVFSLNIVPTAYAEYFLEDNYYVSGTPKGVSFFKDLDNSTKESFINDGKNDGENSDLINYTNDVVGFSVKTITSPWKTLVEDSDGDGIIDEEDMCPNEKGSERNRGCPEEEEEEKEKDSDGDGTIDEEDMCPNEKGSERNRGCPE